MSAARTLKVLNSRRRVRAAGAAYPEAITDRPRTWGECQARGLGTPALPCPYVACRHHLYLVVNPRSGSITIWHPDREPDELADTCVLRFAAAHPHGAEGSRIGVVLNLTRARVWLIEQEAQARMRRLLADEDAP